MVYSRFRTALAYWMVLACWHFKQMLMRRDLGHLGSSMGWHIWKTGCSLVIGE